MARELTHEIQLKWFEVEANDPTNMRESLPIPGVRYYLNHWVLVTRGQHAGTRVSIICLEGLHPEPTYRAELPDGKDIIVAQSSLNADEETWKAAERLRRG
jgi:hypothetical protein